MTLHGKTDGADWDWTALVKSLPQSLQTELDLLAVSRGDRVLVKTRNTYYLFTWKGDGMADLRTNNPKTPSGAVQIMGCSFGLSSSIRPDALFCGGNLELTHQQGEKRWTTSRIDEIHLLHLSHKQSLNRP